MAFSDEERIELIEKGEYIFFNGCSFTYGGELPGWKTGDQWDYTWAHLLAEKFNLPYRNIAMCGNSNDKIFRTTVDALMYSPKPKLVSIMWSSLGRKEFATFNRLEGDEALHIPYDPIGWEQKIPYIRTEKFVYANRDPSENTLVKSILEEWYDKVYTLETAILELLNHMVTIQLLCDEMKIPLHMSLHHSSNWITILNTLTKRGQRKEYVDHVQSQVEYLRHTSRCGTTSGTGEAIHQLGDKQNDILPGGHPGIRTQKIYAGRLYDIIEAAGLLQTNN